jgi:FkbH-like protein
MTLNSVEQFLDTLGQASRAEQPGEKFASLAAWCQRNPSPDAATARRLAAEATRWFAEPDRVGAARALADYDSPASKLIAAALFEGGGEFAPAADVLDSFSCSYSRSVEALRLLAQARNLTQCSRHREAALPLKRAIRLSSAFRTLTAAEKILRRLRAADAVQSPRQCRLAMLGNATFDFALPVLKAVAFAGGIDLATLKGSYNQHVQEVLDGASELHEFAPEITVLALDWRWLALEEPVTDPAAVIAQKLEEIEQIWNSIAANFHCHIIQHNFVVPELSAIGALSSRTSTGRANVIRRLNLALFERSAMRSDVTVLDVDEIASLFGKRAWDDARMWIVAKQYPAPEAAGLLAAHMVALLRALLGISSKCLVLDLDNVLWGGIIGEDGLDGIRLGGSADGEAYVEFQKYVKSLRDRGVILAVCSKNNESDARLPFVDHPEMVLRLDDIAIFTANWSTKVENLHEIARRLNIGLDSMVFVDDNPVERDHVRRSIPEIEVPEMPSDPALYAETLHRELLFETLTITREDAARADSYKANFEREALQHSAPSLDQFLAGLQMQLELRPFDQTNLPRIVQLINKTNQFNLTTRRMTAEQVEAYAARSENFTQFIHLRDRFGNSGITGVLMGSPQGDALMIDLWLMSCRVLGRKVEEAMLSSAWNYSRTAGFKALLGRYAPSPKNGQVADLYERMGFTLLEQSADGERTYRAELNGERMLPEYFVITGYTSAARVT